jgi:hypothetical protein
MIGFDLVIRSDFGHRFKLVIKHLHGFGHLVELGLRLERNMQLLLVLSVKRFALGPLWLKL